MAEINTSPEGRHHHSRRRVSTKVDFTPMVDLGFLLITFFMLTAMLDEHRMMVITLPTGDPGPVAESTVITVILTGNDRVHYYFGEEGSEIETADFSNSGIRKILKEKNAPQIKEVNKLRDARKARQLTDKEYADSVGKVKFSKAALTVVIKSDDKSKYQNLVDMLDEARIAEVAKYSIEDITSNELAMINQLK